MAAKDLQPENHEHNRFKDFLDRLNISSRIPRFPVRKWMAWLGIVLFIVMVIVYYALGGGK